MSARWHVGVDIGGTFTDVVAVEHGGGAVRHLKVPSSRKDPASGVLRGLEALHAEAGVEPAELRLLLHGTTLATNAIIERRLARTALVTTAGFRDVLEIGRHWRTELYDPFIEQPAPLVPRELRLEVRERLDASGDELEPLHAGDAQRVVAELEDVGAQAVAVTFLHSYRNAGHEEEMTALLRAANGWFVCGSAELLGELREYERTATTVLNAALMPLVDDYLERLEGGLAQLGTSASLLITQSNGGALTPRAARTRPVSLALSGPVGGVVACVEIGRQTGVSDLIGFDMGGTSSDVSVVSNLETRFTSELMIGDLPVRLPSVQVHSIGAGGGSLASVDPGGALRVGPESAGSDPGPACYGAGGERPTVTDCQLVLGRLTEQVPLANRLVLDVQRARRAIWEHIAAKLGMSVEEAAAGVIEVANASMERAVRVALRDRGDDARDFALVAFGGAGPLHAAELAQRLSIATVIVPPHPGTLSARGFLSADVRLDFSASDLHRSDEDGLAEAAAAAFAALEERARDEVRDDGQLDESRLAFDRSCDVRYLGQAYEVSVPVPDGELDRAAIAQVIEAFHARHERAYAFSSPDDQCELVTFRLAARVAIDRPPAERPALAQRPAAPELRDVHLGRDGSRQVPTYQRAGLGAGTVVAGPAVVHQEDSTTLIPSFASAEVDVHGNLSISIQGADA